jgi:hypothetical protein
VVTPCNNRRDAESGYHAVHHQDSALQWNMWHHITHINRETMLSIGSVQRQLSGESNQIPCGGRVDTSTVAMQVIGDDENRSLKYETKIWSQVPWDSDSRITVLARLAPIINDKCILLSERALQINKPATVWQ